MDSRGTEIGAQDAAIRIERSTLVPVEVTDPNLERDIGYFDIFFRGFLQPLYGNSWTVP
jgi:hypothetical protein